MQRRRAFKLRLKRSGLVAAEQRQVIDAVGTGPRHQFDQMRALRFPGGDDQLAATAVADAAFGAVVVKQCLAPDAQRGLERAWGIVDACVNHFAVARACFGADRVGRLQHHHLPALQRQGAGDGEPDDAGADDHAFDPFGLHRATLSKFFGIKLPLASCLLGLMRIKLDR